MLESKTETQPAWARTEAPTLATTTPEWRPLTPHALDRAAKVKRRRLLVALAMLAVGFGLITTIELGLGSGGIMYVGIAVLFIYAYSWKAESGVESASTAELAISDNPGGRDEVLARVWILDGDVILGTDTGVFWIENGALYFSGHRTWFRVAQPDFKLVKSAQRLRLFSELSTLLPATCFIAQSRGKKVTIAAKSFEKGGSKSYVRELMAKFGSLKEPSTLETQLPPTTLDPAFAGTVTWECGIGVVFSLWALTAAHVWTGHNLGDSSLRVLVLMSCFQWIGAIPAIRGNIERAKLRKKR